MAEPAGDAVTLAYPYDTGFTPQALEWQMDNGWSFRTLGGYAHATNPNGRSVTLPSPVRVLDVDRLAQVSPLGSGDLLF